MKICFLNIYQGINRRGAETFVSELCKRLSKDNAVEIISDNRIVPEWRRTFLWRIFLDKNSLAVANFTLKKLSKIWKEKYEVVIPMNGGWQPALVRMVTWLYGGKMVISGQSGVGWHERNNLWCFPNAFVALSTKALIWAKEINPFVKSVHIPNGVDLERFTPNGKQLVTNLKKPLVLCVGALTKQKRIDLVIKAVAKLNDVNLLVVGSGGLESELCNLGEKLLGKRFELVSAPHEDMPQIYRCADVFTLVSESSESFGIVLVEAMASGLAVVASDDPVRREVVGNAGLFVDPTDTEAFARTLKKALDIDWGDKPRRQAEKFSWDKIAEEYEELLKNIVKKR